MECMMLKKINGWRRERMAEFLSKFQGRGIKIDS